MRYGKKFSEIRHHVMGLEYQDCRQELADTLEEIDRLEHDFEILCREVAQLYFDENRRVYDTTKEFDAMVERRGVKLPE